ncbi:MAG: ABC transporter permease [Aliihoeflea sp.]|jgi:NitT/TauT family transport system permease protein
METTALPRLIARPSRAQRIWQAAQGVVVPVATLIAVIAIWEALARTLSLPAYLLPAPSRILIELNNVSSHLLPNIMATLTTVLLGFVASIVVAIPLAIAISASPWVARAIYPLLLVTQSTPIIAIAPILVVMAGTGQLSRTLVTFLIAFFPLLVSTVTGLLATPKETVDLARALRMSFWQELRFIRMPTAIPFIFSGLRVAISLSVIGAVVAEFVTANAGLGYLITQSTAFFNVPLAFGAVILLAIMGITLFGCVVLAERLLFPWSVSSDRTTRE